MSNSSNLLERNSIDVNNITENEQFRRFSKIIYSIRAISMFLIIICHIVSWFIYINKISPVYSQVLCGLGTTGLDLLVFTSGLMLVFNILYRDKENHSWIEWYKRRIIRIFPGYWIMIIIILLFYFITLNSYYELTQILVNLSGFQVILIENPNFIIIHFIYWFISALLYCYLLFPIFFYMLRRNSRIATIVGIILFVFLAFYLNSIEKMSEHVYINTFIILRFFIFFFGMSFGFWIGNNNMQNLEKIFQSKFGLSLLFILIGVYTLFAFLVFRGYYFGFMYPIIACIAIPVLIFLFNKFYKINKGLLFFGTRSYEAYLDHSISYFFLEFLFFSLLLLPKGLTTDLIMLPIYILLVFGFASFLNIVLIKINNLKRYHPFIILLAISFFLYSLIALFLFFLIDIFLALFLYSGICVAIILIYHYRKKEKTSKSSE